MSNLTKIDYFRIKGEVLKSPCVVSTINDVVLSAATNIIDGVQLNLNDRVLVRNQSILAENGVYKVISTGLTCVLESAIDFSTNKDVFAGVHVYILSGNTYGDSYFVLSSINPLIFFNKKIYVAGETYPELYYDVIETTLHVPNITLTGSTIKVPNLQMSSDNGTKIIISGDTLYKVTGTTIPSLVINLKTSDYTLIDTDDVILVSGSSTINITMPPISIANPNGYLIKNIGYGIINFNIYNNELIDGYSTVGISNHNTAIKLIPYIDKWYIF
jgi:hypothetical protein